MSLPRRSALIACAAIVVASPAVGAATEWSTLPRAPIAARAFASAVWTGREMIVWGGGASGVLFADGAAYDPVARSWRRLARAPLAGRTGHVAVWTGSRLLVWGGCCDDASRELGDGASYDPVRDAWARIPKGPLSARTGHAAVFTGKEMLVWGGTVFRREFDDGAAFDPASMTWRPLAAAPIAARAGHSAVWTGNEMLVWGGTRAEEALADGAAYDAGAGAWRTMRAAALPARTEHGAVWSGTEMVVSGGCCSDGGEFPDAAAYDPRVDAWRPVDGGGVARAGHVALSLDRADGAVLLWGGRTGARRPREPEVIAGSARVRGAASPLAGRVGTSAVWTGSRMLVWGGCCGPGGSGYGDGASFDPAPLAARARAASATPTIPRVTPSTAHGTASPRAPTGPARSRPWVIPAALLLAAGMLLVARRRRATRGRTGPRAPARRDRSR